MVAHSDLGTVANRLPARSDDAGVTRGSSIGNYQRAHVYTDFARGLVAHAKHFAEERTMHELDIAMMSAAMKCRHVERPCECLPFLAAAFPA